MSKTKRVTITLTQEQQDKARTLSKELFGKENISGFFGFLIERWVKQDALPEDQIILGSEVIVSDPSYEVPTWCQEIIKNVRPGVYNTEVDYRKHNCYGERIHSLTVLHEIIKRPVWKHHSNNIGVHTGQAGVFCMTSYRNDDIVGNLPWLTEKGYPFGNHPYPVKEEGQQWYVKMCDRTLTEKGWGTYDTGVVSSSGYGDGTYELLVTEMDGMIHGFKIIFILI